MMLEDWETHYQDAVVVRDYDAAVTRLVAIRNRSAETRSWCTDDQLQHRAYNEAIEYCGLGLRGVGSVGWIDGFSLSPRQLIAWQ
jgi:hypothetical protein